MLKIPSFSPRQWPEKSSAALVSTLSAVVFAVLDLLDVALCFVYGFLDGILDNDPHSCYCNHNGEQGSPDGNGEEESVSETLYRRRNLFREMGFVCLRGRRGGGRGKGGLRRPRWSDCGCESCVEWQMKGGEKLHLVVMEPSKAMKEDCGKESIESVIFIHGFLSSSLLWVETVFPNLSEAAKLNLRMFAVDLLGFGRSPKPVDCMYRLKEHLEMIERSIFNPFQLNSFHLVAHSMGCIIALALAAKYPESIKTITLVAPPYFPSTEVEASHNASHNALNRLAERKIWPPLLFGLSVMSWYEHLGRTVCFIICKNHLKWEWIIKFLTGRRDPHFMIRDITEHTHHSAWHTMHNVVCGGAKLMDKYLEAVKRAGIVVTIIQGDKDQVVPVQCSYKMKLKIPDAKLQIINGANHSTVIFGREKIFTRDLEGIWFSSCKLLDS